MQVTAKLNNLRITSRKVRQVTNLVRGMGVKNATAQLKFMSKKSAPLVFKLLNSAISNAKHDFNLNEENLYISKLVVEAGPSLKRWLPRAMGRATPLLKRTCSIILVLDERIPTKKVSKRKIDKPEIRAGSQVVEQEEKITAVPEEKEIMAMPTAPQKPYGASSKSKKRFFSRQTFGNIKKVFRRKSI